MKPTTIIYWTRTCLGVVAALLSTLLGSFVHTFSFLDGLTIAILVYIVTHYVVYKSLFLTKVEKTSKIFTTGIFAYFLTWIVAFASFSTLTAPTLTITSPAPNTVFYTENTVTVVAKITNQFGTTFSGANVTANSPKNTLIQLEPNPASPGTYQATYNITSSDPAGAWNIKVAASINGIYREASTTVLIQTSS